jgi:fructose-1,6-bisphosphatase/inositol monophosphatase family enzyme
MTNWNKDEVARLLRLGADIALKYFDAPRLDYKKDASVVTQADREIENAFAECFDAPEEGSWLLGEETLAGRSEGYIQGALSGTAWIVDPIDGTASYAHHFPMWAISIGYARGGNIAEGAVYLPMEGEMLVSEGDAVYHAKGRPASNEPADFRIFSPPAAVVDDKLPIALAQRCVRAGGYTGRNVLHATASAVFCLTHLMLGHYLAYMAELKLWDLAGGLALLDKLGCASLREDGQPLNTRITEENYALDPSAGPGRWRAKGRPVFAVSGEAVHYARSCFQKP